MLEQSLNYRNRKWKLKVARDSPLLDILTFLAMLEDRWIVGGLMNNRWYLWVSGWEGGWIYLPQF
jgi:hypothetical protein